MDRNKIERASWILGGRPCDGMSVTDHEDGKGETDAEDDAIADALAEGGSSRSSHGQRISNQRTANVSGTRALECLGEKGLILKQSRSVSQEHGAG